MLRRRLPYFLVCALCSCVATIYMLQDRTGVLNGDKRALSPERRKAPPSELTLATAASAINKPDTPPSEITFVTPATNGNGPPPVACDSECRRFQRLMAAWPRDKPKAALVYLVHRVQYLVPSIQSVSDFFCRQFDYPIVIFHEAGPFSTPATRSQVLGAAAWNSSRVFFQQVEFKLPTFLTKPVLDHINCIGTIGYRHMCRFQAKGVFEQPVIKELEYMWRLDDDSKLLSPVKYDIFRFMRNRHLDYGYVWRHLDASKCVTGLWEATNEFLRRTKIKPQFFDRWRVPYIFYNNFEVSRLSVWLSTGYRSYVDYIDRKGGIYYHRWGDAPIKAIAVSIFIPENRTHFFTDIGYQHGSFVNGETNFNHVNAYNDNPQIRTIL